MCSQCRGSSAGGACDGTDDDDDDAVSALLLLLVVHSGITKHRFRDAGMWTSKKVGVCPAFVSCSSQTLVLLRPSRLDAVTKNIVFYDILALCTVLQPQTRKAKKKTPKHKLFPSV